MTLLLGLLFLVNLIGFQWAIFASIIKEKKIERNLKETLKNASRLRKMHGHVVCSAFYRSAMAV